MICLLAGNYFEAKRFADANLLEPDEWFFPIDKNDLRSKKNFHVLVIGTAGQNVHPSYFENVLKLAKERGRMK